MVLLALIAVPVGLFALQRGYLPLSCTVGLAGAAVSVTAEGLGAGGVCSDMNRQTTNQGVFNVYGTAICEQLYGGSSAG